MLPLAAFAVEDKDIVRAWVLTANLEENPSAGNAYPRFMVIRQGQRSGVYVPYDVFYTVFTKAEKPE